MTESEHITLLLTKVYQKIIFAKKVISLRKASSFLWQWLSEMVINGGSDGDIDIIFINKKKETKSWSSDIKGLELFSTFLVCEASLRGWEGSLWLDWIIWADSGTILDEKMTPKRRRGLILNTKGPERIREAVLLIFFVSKQTNVSFLNSCVLLTHSNRWSGKKT